MARLSKSALGEIRGKMGTLVIRRINGREFISHRPAKYRKTKKKVPARQKMQSAVQFSRTVNNSDKLKLIWEKSKIKATNSYQKLIKHTLENAEPGRLTIKNKITPGGISLSFSEFLFENGKLNVSITNRDKETRSVTGKNFSVYILFYFYEPKVKRIDSSSLELISKDIDGAAAEDNFLFNYDEGKVNPKALKNYKKCIVYFAIVGNKPNTKTLSYSGTIAKEFIIN
jgi:hypothetical protein